VTTGSIPQIVPIELRHIESFGECVGEVALERSYLAIVEAFAPEQNALWVALNRARGNPLHVALDHQDRVVGWCEIRRDTLPGREHCGVLGIGVRAPFRRAGLGRRLIDSALADAWRRGFERIELWVRSPNAAAIHLYEQVGFVEEGRRRDAVRLDQGPEDEVLMARFALARSGAAPARVSEDTQRTADRAQRQEKR
jgi:ribosomal protein S18 acetylase RimI-like enzyme